MTDTATVETPNAVRQHGDIWRKVGPDLWEWTHLTLGGHLCVHRHSWAEVVEFGPWEPVEPV
jgi:hypothetical protein